MKECLRGKRNHKIPQREMCLSCHRVSQRKSSQKKNYSDRVEVSDSIGLFFAFYTVMGNSYWRILNRTETRSDLGPNIFILVSMLNTDRKGAMVELVRPLRKFSHRSRGLKKMIQTMMSDVEVKNRVQILDIF